MTTAKNTKPTVSATAALTTEYNELARVAKITTAAPKSKAALEKAIASMKATLKAKAKRNVPSGFVSAADIAREVGVNPKVARAKLRRMYAGKDAKALPKVNGDAWLFAQGDHDRVIELLTR